MDAENGLASQDPNLDDSDDEFLRRLKQLHEAHEESKAMIQNIKEEISRAMARIDEVQASMILMSMVSPKTGVSVTKPEEDGVGFTASPQRSSKRKEKEVDLGEDLNNVITTISDDEDLNITKKHCPSAPTMNYIHPTSLTKPHVPSAWTIGSGSVNKKDVTPATVICQTNGKRTPSGQDAAANDDSTGLTVIVKKLFQTPSPTSHGPHSLLGNLNLGSNSGRVRYRTNEGRVPMHKITASHIPRGIKWKFRATTDLHLSPLEVVLSTYLFHPQQDPSELVLNTNRGLAARRSDFDSLCPGKLITDKVLKMVVEQLWWVQKNMTEPKDQTVWFLPPSFAEDAQCGVTPHELLEAYHESWMEPNPRLKYIYVPIKDIGDHWYLMVICTWDDVIYQLDSHLNPEDMDRRTEVMRSLAHTLSLMVCSGYYSSTFLSRDIEFGLWDIKQVQGIPNSGRSDNSGVWVIDWLATGYKFSASVIGTLRENAVRMKTVMNILLGLNNVQKNSLEEKAITFWRNLPH